jgi:uncharacterized protein (TIGR03437 family)
LQFSDGTVRTINIFSSDPAASCGSLKIQWRMPAQAYITVTQNIGHTFELQVTDSCGNPVADSVQATFSNGDAPLNLVHIGNGIWTGTWQPQSIVPATVTVTAIDTASAAMAQATPLFASVVPGSAPIITPDNVQLAATMALGAPVAPGSLITLPYAAASTQVLMGSESLPLLYGSSGQINVQIPFDVPVNTDFQLTVQQGSALSLPVSLVIASVQPGIFTVDGSGTGQGIIYRSDGLTLAQPGTSAVAGETITLYCSGLGTVSPAVPAGTAPPSSPLSYTDHPVSVTIAGQDSQASSASLVPGQPGIYQVSAVVPAGVSGDGLPVILTIAGVTSPPVTMSIQ